MELASPLHCGWRTAGNLKQTRPYVPGSVFWGALARRLALDRFQANYQEAEDCVNANVRFTYFFPTLDRRSVTHWPWDRQASQFDWLYLNSYVSTALLDGRSNDDGLLHETEYIVPRARHNSGKSGEQTFLLGYLWLAEGFDLDCQTINRLQLGGERGYGWGRVRAAQLDPLLDGEPVFESWIARADPAGISLQTSSQACLPALTK